MRKLNGYRPSHRNKWHFITNDTLSLSELSYWDYCIDVMDFDPDHDTYGMFRFDLAEVIKTFRKGKSTVRNWHNKLLLLGCIQATNRKGVYRLPNATRYISEGPRWKGEAMTFARQEMNQSFEEIVQSTGVKIQSIGQNVQPVGKQIVDSASKIPVKALSSSKDESNLNHVRKVLIKQEVHSENEYQQMYQENPDGLTPDDMRWVDENVIETLEVDAENEESIVDLYFDGDWQKYRNNLTL
ncbi:MAG: hypothetical protein HY430_01560 [Candidatus Levybacteria bacterium]|nr:hypothetical protein [Candidatus Levybacteria bacterium]